MTLFALILGRLKKGRNPLLLVMSVMTLFWLQPSQPENSWRFWFPFMTLFLVMLAWLLTSTKNQRSIKNNFLTIIVMTVIPLSLTLTRYLKFENIYLTEIPRIQVVLTVTLVGFALVVLLIYLQRSISSVLLLLMLIGLITIFMIIKSPELLSISANLLSKGEVPPVEAISWLGYSYVAFRLIHTIRDSRTDRQA
jgi:alginate O-acetyltransferase complex protein AlgI